MNRPFKSLPIIALAFFCLRSPALVVNATYDTSVTGSAVSAQIQSAFGIACSYLQSVVTNNMTLNITVYYGTNNVPFSGGLSLGESVIHYTGTNTYLQMVAALRNARTSGVDSNAVASLPASDPLSTGSWWYTRAQAKALGLFGLNANDAIEDGKIGFADTLAYSFDPTNRAAGANYDFIGVALHEMTEIMGRTTDDLTGTRLIYDLFRFSAPATRTFSSTTAFVYFSADNGTNNLRNFHTNSATGDLNDWEVSGLADSFDWEIFNGAKTIITYADMAALDVIGYKVNYDPPMLAGSKRGNNFVGAFTNLPGTTYTIYSTTNLTLPNWTILGTNNDIGTPGQFSFTNNATTNTLRFYRLKLN